MIVSLAEARDDTCGAKAGRLGRLMRAGFDVPDGFAIPFSVYRDFARDLPVEPQALRREIESRDLPAGLYDLLSRALADLDAPSVAVRSSASDEDRPGASAAGQYESVLAVRGTVAVAAAVRVCWGSLHGSRAVGYRADGAEGATPAMGVLVQRLVEAESSGVLFTPTGADDSVVIESSWGLGTSVVGGAVTPDNFQVARDGTIRATIADKVTRVDRENDRLLPAPVAPANRKRPSLTNDMVKRLAALGRQIALALGAAQDIEFAVAGNNIWVLQARPVTSAPVTRTANPSANATGLSGIPGSSGSATGLARVIRGPADFAKVRPGDILVCPHTDPAWTPLLQVAGGVVTEVGGTLSHAAIVAREHGIPAVLAVRDAMSLVPDGAIITIDGSGGNVTIADH